jgi:hypothetical protein
MVFLSGQIELRERRRNERARVVETRERLEQPSGNVISDGEVTGVFIGSMKSRMAELTAKLMCRGRKTTTGEISP